MAEESSFVFDVNSFKRRYDVLLELWEKDENLSKIDAFAFIIGNDDIVGYSKSSSLQEWLYGYDLQDTLTIIFKNQTIIYTGKKKAEFLSPIQNVVKNTQILTRNREDSFLDRFNSFFNSYSQTAESFIIGIFEKDKFGGNFAESWYKYMETANFKKHDISMPISNLLSVKDSVEIKLTQQAATVCSQIYDQVAKQKILDIIDDETRVRHSKLAIEFENSLENGKFIPSGISSNELEICFPPIIQSGGKYNLKFSATSDDNPLEYDCILTFLGVRYKYYCSALVRTIMVKPSEDLKKLYSFLLKLTEILYSELKTDAKFCDIYNKLYDSVKENYPQYIENFVKNAGFVTGLEFRESIMVLDPKNTNIVKSGMTFCTLLGFQNVQIGSNKPISIAIGDTLSISDEKCNVLTTSKKSLGSLVVLLNEEEENESSVIVNKSSKAIPATKTRAQPDAIISDSQRKLHQEELKKKLNEEAKRRLLQGDEACLKKNDLSSKNYAGSYSSASDLPKESDVINLKICVDKKAETVVLPIFGMSVPFHISTIKNVSSNTEGDHTYLRINFNVILAPNAKHEDLSIAYGRNVYIKEMVYRALNTKLPSEISAKSSNLISAFNLIKELQKTFKNRVQEESEMEGIEKQADLILTTNKVVPRLKEVSLRPQMGTRKTLGVFEAHVNGFRYSSTKAEHVDILYKNIKHAFFQPCDGEAVITLHFHLKSPILIGKKKYKDIQVYNEIGEIVSDLGKNNSNMLDRDEIEAEENEREGRNKLKMIFKSFVERVENLTNNQLEFEVPFRELGFQGVPFKSSVLLLPTTHCLINIIEQPSFIITLDDIELVHFERVVFHMKHFDMVIVFKDYNRKVCNISSVPMSSLEAVKDWLNSCDIKFTESIQNLNWNKIMKTILDDPQEFFSTGGWSFLDPESDNDDNQDETGSGEVNGAGKKGRGHRSDEEDGDEEYCPEISDDDNEGEEGSETGSEDYESENSEFTEDESGSGDEDEESGKSWSELEEEARAHDALRHGGEVSPVDRKRKAEPKSIVNKKQNFNRKH